MIKGKSIFMDGVVCQYHFILVSYVLKWHVIKGIQHKKTSSAKFENLLKIKIMLLYI